MSLHITNGRVFGGTPNILIFWLFLDNLNISEQTIDRALTIHTELYIIMIQWRKVISFDFHHIPKLSIGFNSAELSFVELKRVCSSEIAIIKS